MTRSVALALERLCANLRHKGVYAGTLAILEEHAVTMLDVFGGSDEPRAVAARLAVLALMRSRGVTRATMCELFDLEREELDALMPLYDEARREALSRKMKALNPKRARRTR